MAEELRVTTRRGILDAVTEDNDLDLLLQVYLPTHSEQDLRELKNSIQMIVARAICYAELMAGRTPEDVMAIYNAGIAEGSIEEHARGFEEGYLRAIDDLSTGQGA